MCSDTVFPEGTVGPMLPRCGGGELTTEESAFLCPSGTALVGGVCTAADSTGVMAWLSTGNNAMYAGGAVLGFVVLLMMTGGRG
jgi:hypothetical protein